MSDHLRRALQFVIVFAALSAMFAAVKWMELNFQKGTP